MTPPLALELIDKAEIEKASFLDLGNCGLTAIPEEITRLTLFLRELNLGPRFFSVDNQYTESKNQGEANNFSGPEVDFTLLQKLELTSLYLSTTYLLDNLLPLVASNLTSLTSLQMSWNQLTDVGAQHIAQHLTSLTSLQMSWNQLTDVGAQHIAQHLTSLTSLDISRNQLTDVGIERLANIPSLTNLFVSDNKSKSIPETFLYNIKALRDYFLSTKIDNNFVRVILMGNTTSGKSSLANFLVDGTFADVRESTHGIKLWKWYTDPENPKNNLTVNIWDFGGQDYYHATHTLFRSERTLFLFLHTDEETHKKPDKETNEQSKPEENQYLKDEYWLANIQSLAAERSYAWFVQSKYEPDPAGLPIQRMFLHSEAAKTIIRNQFALSVKRAFKNDADSVLNFTYFRESLLSELRKLATEKLQVSWLKVRDEYLIKWRRNTLYLSKEDFWKKCHAVRSLRNDFIDKPDILLRYLRDCGEIVWFENNAALKDKIYLSVDKLTSELFKLLNKQIISKQGSFTLSTLSTKDRKGFEEYLKILLEFKLIFKKIDTDDTYIVPQYLPENPYTIHFQQLIQIAYVIKLPYLPRALVTRFLVTYANAKESHYWRYGAFFKKGNFHLFVQMDVYQQTVTIHISDGPTREKYNTLNELFEFFTLPERKEVHLPNNMPPSQDGSFRPERVFLSDDDKKRIQLSTDGNEFATLAVIEDAIRNKVILNQIWFDVFLI